MHLMLAPQEHEVLLWAVKGAISDLGTEIGHKGMLLMVSPRDGQVEATVEICSKKK